MAGGQIATVDDSGKSLAGDFEGQVRQIFKLLNATLEKAGGKLERHGSNDRVHHRRSQWRSPYGDSQRNLR